MSAAQTLRRLIGPLELIHREAGPRLLWLARVGILGLWLLKLLLDPLWRLAQLPRELYVPTGAMALLPDRWVDALFTPGGLTTLWLATFAAVAWSLTGRFFTIVATTAAVLLTAYSSVIRSFGPAVHTDIILLLAVYVFALFSWADLIAGKTRAGNWSSFPLVTIVALLCLSYSLVGMNRLMLGGWQAIMGDSMEVWTIDASLRAYYFNTNIGWHVPQWPAVLWGLKSGLPAITFFEITAPLCLVSVRFRMIFIPVMLSFHLLSLVFMNIFFFDNVLLYLLLVDWSRYFPRLRSTAG